MKILVNSTIRSTIEYFLIPQIKMLSKMNHEVYVAAANIDNFQLIEGIAKLVDISYSRNLFRLQNIKAFFSVRKLLKDQEFDLIYTHTPIASAIIRVVNYTLKRKAKVVYFVHGFHFHSKTQLGWYFFYPLEKILSKVTQSFIVINDEDYLVATKYFRLDSIIKVDGVGIDLIKYRTNRGFKNFESKSKLNLLSVGELNKNKNHISVIKALRLLDKDIDFHYTICGKGPQYKKIKKKILKYNLLEKVTLAGHVENVVNYYKKSDIFIHPSLREGLPVSIMEAMACGLPVIANNIRGNSDLIQHNVNGYLYNNDSVSLAQYIIKLISSPEKYIEISNKNFVTAKKRFNFELITRDILSHLIKVANI